MERKSEKKLLRLKQNKEKSKSVLTAAKRELKEAQREFGIVVNVKRNLHLQHII